MGRVLPSFRGYGRLLSKACNSQGLKAMESEWLSAPHVQRPSVHLRAGGGPRPQLQQGSPQAFLRQGGCGGCWGLGNRRRPCLGQGTGELRCDPTATWVLIPSGFSQHLPGSWTPRLSTPPGNFFRAEKRAGPFRAAGELVSRDIRGSCVRGESLLGSKALSIVLRESEDEAG